MTDGRVVFELAVIEQTGDDDHCAGVVSCGISPSADPHEIAALLARVARAMLDGDLFIAAIAERN